MAVTYPYQSHAVTAASAGQPLTVNGLLTDGRKFEVHYRYGCITAWIGMGAGNIARNGRMVLRKSIRKTLSDPNRQTQFVVRHDTAIDEYDTTITWADLWPHLEEVGFTGGP